jgi:tetratricopeptide (TPR) repeat protein
LLVTQQRTRLQIRAVGGCGLIVLQSSSAGRSTISASFSAAQQSITVGDQASGQLKWNDAISEYSKALATITTNPELYAKRASMLVQVSRFDEALKDLDKPLH